MDAKFTTYSHHPFSYGGDDRDWITSLLKNIHARVTTEQSKVMKLLQKLAYEFLKICYFAYLVLTRNVFVFIFGVSMLRRNLDLPILRLLGKRVVCNLGFGSDVRPPYINGALVSNGGSYPTAHELDRLSIRNKAVLRRAQRWANVVIGAPYSTSHFACKPFINHFALGLPSRRDKPDPLETRPGNAVRILHSPSHPIAKGTEKIREAIEVLKERGYPIDYVEISNLPNREVLQEIGKCDFIVDQLYSDTPLAGFATEAAWLGKPAVVGGYGLDSLAEHVPEGMYPPSQTCHPKRIVDAIEEMIRDKDFREKLGEASRDFVGEKWSVTAVAQRYLRLMDNNIPRDWWVDPKSITYVHGGGLPEDRTRKIVGDLIRTRGTAALHLSHRPDLEKAFIDFAGAAE